jgi:hypothetical protein
VNVPARSSVAHRVEIIAMIVAFGYTAALVAFAMNRCCFYGDDFSNFLVLRNETFWRGLLASVGGQVVPLARTVNDVFYVLFGLNYPAALAVLCAFHGVGLLYLYRTLNLSKRTPLNAVLVALYACYVYTWVVLGWWIAGVERVPFVAFSCIALYHFLRYRGTGARRDLVIAAVADLVALGFYVKALLLPLVLVAADLTRLEKGELREAPRSVNRSLWGVAGALTLLGAACVVAEHRAGGVLTDVVGKASLTQPLQFVQIAFVLYAHSLLAVALDWHAYAIVWWVAPFWGALIAYTLYRAPRTWVGWSALAVLAFLNFAMIAASNRVSTFGALMAFEIRYYWELCFFTMTLLGFVLHKLPGTSPEARWAKTAPQRALLGVLGAAALAGYAALSYRSFSATAFNGSDGIPRTRAFMDNLRGDLRRLASETNGPIRLVDGALPDYINGLDLTFRRQSQLLSLMREPVTFQREENADYAITADGHVIRLEHGGAGER